MFVFFRHYYLFNVCYLSQFSTSVLSNVIWNFFEAGDMTEVGEKGLSLRSVVYFDADTGITITYVTQWRTESSYPLILVYMTFTN